MGLFWSWYGLPLGWLVAATFLLMNFLLLINNKRHGILGLGKAVLSNALLYLQIQMKVLWVCHGLSSALHETGNFLVEVARLQRGRGRGRGGKGDSTGMAIWDFIQSESLCVCKAKFPMAQPEERRQLCQESCRDLSRQPPGVQTDLKILYTHTVAYNIFSPTSGILRKWSGRK